MKIELTSVLMIDGRRNEPGWVLEVAPEVGRGLIELGHKEVAESVRAKKNPAIYDGGCMPVVQPTPEPEPADHLDTLPNPRTPFFGKKIASG